MTIKKYKNILITGASSGIGKQMAIDYAEPGVNLYLSGSDVTNLLIDALTSIPITDFLGPVIPKSLI